MSGPGIGHNNGPSLEPGRGFRRHAWRRARADLLPRLPIEILRVRVARAKALGLPYRTYAGVRASTGRDVIGFLFSTNALRLLRPGQVMPEDRGAKLAALEADRVALVQGRLDPGAVLIAGPLDAAHPAPAPADGWAATRDRVQGVLRDRRLPADAVLVIGETHLERDWSEAARMAGFIDAARYFAPMG